MFEFDLNLLTHLSVLLQTRSVTEAARRVGVSQPAMSRSLGELRRLFGDPLLVRTRGGMLPTRRAEELLDPLQNWLAQAGSIMAPATVDPTTLVRRFRIAAGEYATHRWLEPVFTAFKRFAPGVSIDIQPLRPDNHEQLASGEVDITITSVEPDPRLHHCRHLSSETFACVAETGHPLVSLSQVRALEVADLLEWPHVGSMIDGRMDPLTQLFIKSGCEDRVIMTAPYGFFSRDLLADTGALMLLPTEAARGHARNHGLEWFEAPPELGRLEHWLVWHNRNHRDAATQWLIGEILTAPEQAGDTEGSSADAGLFLEAAE
ncbi:MAG TPA: LysR family transcriptional regulator [Allosphingosinicella sp.]|uniref:LysR family transcriptional regulator n=1 Tax=Allosphingosinicella sp. TaxID=2823234 RepID=UPI002EDAD032